MTKGPETLRVHMTGSEWFGAAPGGLNRYFTDLYAALARNPEVTVSAAAFGPPADGGGSWGDIGGSTARRARTAFLARHALRDADILDRHFCLYGPPALGPRGRIPLVVHFHGPWAAESRITGQGPLAVKAKYFLERLRYAGAARIVVLSNHFGRLLSDEYGIPAQRIAVLPPGVDLDRFRAEPIPESSRTVLCVRRLERRMGIDVLLRCWPGVRRVHPDARLVIVGTGTAERELRSLAAGLDDRVEFAGRVDDAGLAELYAGSVCTVAPTVALEGFGLIALESLAAGRAPIVTDCGGLPDSVRGLDPSLIVPAKDADALGARLVAALNGALPTPAECRAHAATFSWDVTAARHLTMYREITR
ncbi:glycosyltransferase [Nocardia arthritidis]|uniref:Glycosyltransferase n=2 Tax=Nocardia arthritidis TaxID=228602 RepID=A0A6G9YFN3_9NOCA|nr:glycosyltransferase [Nocardia arthritidis]